jgi:hypothetical protein
MQATSIGSHQRNLGIARWVLVTALIGCLLGLGTAPAHARYGSHHIYVYISSGEQGPLGPSSEASTKTIVRRVQPGKGVAFDVTATGRGTPSHLPFVRGCSSSGGIGVRYIFEGDRHDHDITYRVTHDGWKPTVWGPHYFWRVSIRVAFHVGDRVDPNSQLSCDVSVNGRPVNATVEVA